MFTIIKTFVKYSLPAFLVAKMARRKKYDLPLKTPAGEKSKTVKCLLLVAPYWVTAVFRMKKKSDKSILKYFMPYGIMKRLVARRHKSLAGTFRKMRSIHKKAFRFFLPYGVVLWWDNIELPRLANIAKARKGKLKSISGAGMPGKAKIAASARKTNEAELKQLANQIKKLNAVFSKKIDGCFCENSEKMEKRFACLDSRISDVEVLLLRILSEANDLKRDAIDPDSKRS